MADIDQNHWRARYTRLLEAARITADHVRTAYTLEGQTSRPQGLSLADCLTDTSLLEQRLLPDPTPGADYHRQLRIHASVAHQDIAISVIAPLTVRLFLTGKTARVTPDDIILGPDSGDTGWQWQEPGRSIGIDEFRDWMSEQVTAWYPIFRKDLGVSPGAYWSSTALGLAAPFSVLYNTAPPQWLCDEATLWLETFSCSAKRYVDWIPAVFSGNTCAIPQRRGCCLKYLLPEGGYCGTCGVYRKQRLAEARINQQTNPASGYWQPPQ